jgi:hypothetical protein
MSAMSGEVEFDPPDMAALSKRLKAAGKTELAKNMNKQINQTMTPVRRAFKASALKKLPRRGGLNVLVSKTKYRTQKNKNGVRLIARNAYELEKLDNGKIRHPSFGHKPWTTQTVKQGVFSEPWEENAKNVRDGVNKAITDTISEVEGEF